MARIGSMARAQDILTEANFAETDIRRIVAAGGAASRWRAADLG